VFYHFTLIGEMDCKLWQGIVYIGGHADNKIITQTVNSLDPCGLGYKSEY